MHACAIIFKSYIFLAVKPDDVSRAFIANNRQLYNISDKVQ
jgi:hypothetical protein